MKPPPRLIHLDLLTIQWKKTSKHLPLKMDGLTMMIYHGRIRKKKTPTKTNPSLKIKATPLSLGCPQDVSKWLVNGLYVMLGV